MGGWESFVARSEIEGREAITVVGVSWQLINCKLISLFNSLWAVLIILVSEFLQPAVDLSSNHLSYIRSIMNFDWLGHKKDK